ncbi:hypothetical protein UlMin_033747 [Ulmus minor]
MADEANTEVTGPIRRVLLISAGASHSVALLCNIIHMWTTAYSGTQMEVYSWGWGDFGMLGHGNSSDLLTPQLIKALQGLRIKQIACGDSHCLAVTMEGEVQSWGRNQNGQLGLSSNEDSLVPQKIQAFQGVSIKMVAAGAEHTAAITEDGSLYGWGWGRYGNLGLGGRNHCLAPQKVSTVDAYNICFLVWFFIYIYGWSKYGQLGHGDFEDYLVPCKLEALSGSFFSETNPSTLVHVESSKIHQPFVPFFFFSMPDTEVKYLEILGLTIKFE